VLNNNTMTYDPFHLVDERRREIARDAFAALFGAGAATALTPLSGGISGAMLFRVDVRGRPYLLRLEGVPSPLRNPHQYESMRIAADANVAPKLLHVDEVHGLMIGDFIAQQPLRSYPGGRAGLVQAFGALLRRVQAAPAFPYFVDYPDIVSRLFAHVVRTGLFAQGLLDRHVERLQRIQATLPWDRAALVSSHNDPVPRNILFDGERLWLIDWESAYRNDPLADVAIALDSMAPSPELETLLLQATFGRAPDVAMRERLAAVRSLTRLYYAGVLLSASATRSRETPDADLAAPSARDFSDALRDGRLKEGAPDTVHILGKIYLSAFLTGEPVPPLADIDRLE
jgi:aminoglycoside phosphotransferase (APT) family kinase protein